jgi:hypothetical protein
MYKVTLTAERQPNVVYYAELYKYFAWILVGIATLKAVEAIFQYHRTPSKGVSLESFYALGSFCISIFLGIQTVPDTGPMAAAWIGTRSRLTVPNFKQLTFLV